MNWKEKIQLIPYLPAIIIFYLFIKPIAEAYRREEQEIREKTKGMYA